MVGWATSIEAGCPVEATHHDLAKAFRGVYEQSEEGSLQREFARWEMWLFDLMLTDPGDYRDEWGPLAPSMVFPPNVYPPPIDRFPEECVPHFTARLDVTTRSVSESRIADFLWIRTHDVVFADRAAAAYRKAASEVLGSDLGNMFSNEYLRRAVEISRSLGRRDPDLEEILIVTAETFAKQHKYAWLCFLVEFADRELASYPIRARPLLENITQASEEYARRGGQERHVERSLLETGSHFAGVLGDTALKKRLMEGIPRSLEAEARERSADGALIQSVLLQDAFKSYADLGMAADVSRLKKEVHDATVRASEEMREISTSVEIPTEEIEKSVERILEAGARIGPAGHLIFLGCSRELWPPWSDVDQQTQDFQQKFPLQTLVRKFVVGPDGRPLPRPEDPQAERLFNEIEVYLRRLQISLALTRFRIGILRERKAWSVDLIMEALADGVAFGEETLDAIRPGVSAYEEGRFWESAHVLAPQVERVIRHLALLAGVEVYKYDARAGWLRWASLETLLSAQELRRVLNFARPDLADELSYIMIDPRGWNLRNDIAHGVLSPAQQDDDLGPLLLILILLCLATFRQKEDPSPESHAE